jgi:ethanolamine utilization protein EutN
MIICKVIGTVVASVKHKDLVASKLLIVQEIVSENEMKGKDLFVATDSVGAGDGDVVLVTRGSNACADGSFASATKMIPIDASIVGIVDNFSIDGKIKFRK